MKKNISINLQGLIFHIEEDGYEVLQRYLQDVKAHFSTYRGHEEIVADIEGRIAELFAARTSSLKQVITFEDVEEMIGKMGRVQDFQQEGSLDDDDDAADVNSYGQPVGATSGSSYTSGGYAGSTTSGTSTTAPGTATDEPRRLYRDMANRKIAGVAAGLARYFGVEALWMRLLFLCLLIVPRILFNNGGALENFGENISGFAVIAYIILWIALPKRYDGTPESQQDPTFKKLYRDTDNGKVGGVSAGLAAYFKIDVVLVRILFIAFLFAGGFAIPLYIVLWILVPEAKTVTEKMRMRGDAVTLSSLDETVRNQAYEAGAVSGSNRPVGTFLEELARNLRPMVNFLGTLIRWFAAALLIFIGFSLLVGLAVILGVALGLIPESNHIQLGDVPAYTVLAGVPWWFVLSGFLAAGIPVLLLLLLGIGLLSRRSIVSRTVSLSLLGLWLLGVVGSVMGGVRLAREFEEEGAYTMERPLGALPFPTVTLDARDTDRDWSMHPRLTLAPTDSGAVIRLTEDRYAQGPTEAAASALARTSISYRAVIRDSAVILDDRFAFQPGAIFRGQRLDLTLRLPRDKQYRLTDEFLDLISSDDFVNNTRPENPTKHLYRLRGNQFECIDCTPEDMTTDGDDNDDDDINVDVNGERVHISMGDGDDDDEAVSFSTSAEDYGSARRSFTEANFNRLDVSGAYQVVVRQGAGFQVKAAGRERELQDMEVRRNGNELVIRPRRQGLFSGWNNRNNKSVLIEIEMPSLEAIDISGAVQTKATGFTSQNNLQVQQTGASHFAFEGECTTLTMELAGACRSSLRGRASKLRLEGAGACRVQAPDFTTDVAEVELAGVSKARLRVERELRAEVSGASEVRYSGNPTKVRIEDSGASHVRRVE